LKKVNQSDLIVSLPYAREAAKILAKKLDIPVLELDLPLGLEKTATFVKKLAESYGRETMAEEFIDKELTKIIEKTEKHIMRFISGKYVFHRLSDPFLTDSLKSFFSELGLVEIQKEALLSFIKTNYDEADLKNHQIDTTCQVLYFCNTMTTISDHIKFNVPFVQILIGYPIYTEHPIEEKPFLGFAGVPHLIEKITTAILNNEAKEEKG